MKLFAFMFAFFSRTVNYRPSQKTKDFTFKYGNNKEKIGSQMVGTICGHPLLQNSGLTVERNNWDLYVSSVAVRTWLRHRTDSQTDGK